MYNACLQKLYAGFVLGFPLVLAGCGTPSLLITPVQSAQRLEEATVKDGKGFSPPKIAMIDVEGMLANVKSPGLLSPGENKLAVFDEQLNLAADDPAVVAVVLRVNSPGGTVTASDNMYDLVQRFKAKTHKPVVASAQEVCASGAYYVSCSADQIVANPTSIVGSVGVIYESFDVSGLMAKIGVKSEPVKSGPLKDMGSPFKPLAPDARDVMQGLINEYYARFTGIVREHRTKLTDPERIKTATDGRVFSGEQALTMGLIDKVGRLDDAIDLAKELAHAPGAKVVIYHHSYESEGSIYAKGDVAAPQATASSTPTINVNLAENDLMLPRGFYYLWQP